MKNTQHLKSVIWSKQNQTNSKEPGSKYFI